MQRIVFPFNPDKALEVLVYIASKKCTNMYHVLKIIYFADKKHLELYGRPICGGTYSAMANGPVPSEAYDMVKLVPGYPRAAYVTFNNIDDIRKSLEMAKYNLIPKRKCKLELLSDTDLECIDAEIRSLAHLSFKDLLRLSHSDPAFKKVENKDDSISIETIIQTLKNGEELMNYLLCGS